MSSSELLVTLPSRAAKVYERNSEVNVFELPFAVKPFNVSVNWYNHRDDFRSSNSGLSKLYKIFLSFLNSNIELYRIVVLYILKEILDNQIPL